MKGIKYKMEEIRILTPTSMLGYGFPINWFNKGLKFSPGVITVDSGSTDSGPHKLGMGALTCSMEAYYKDIYLILEAGSEYKIPVYISSAGGSGTDNQLEIINGIIKKICREKKYKLKVATIHGEINKEIVREKLKKGKIKPCGPVEDLEEQEINEANVIVAQMGIEPYLKAMDMNVDVIISGRTYDPVPTAAFGIKKGFDPGLCWHMGKIMECGALCAVPSGKSILGYLKNDCFILEPLDPQQKCTPTSVAAHTLYEKGHPWLLPGPGGMLDLSDCVFEKFDDRTVSVSGSKFIPSKQYTVKLEGSKKLGYRTIFIAGIRDPLAIKNIDKILKNVEVIVKEYFSDIPKKDYEMIFHVYGKNGVMGEFEIHDIITSHELCIILEVSAQNQELATAICSRTRTELLHFSYEGRIATAGNIALPFTPLEIQLGGVYRFNIYHLMEIDDPCELFQIDIYNT